ncbi:MAG: L,D-transpeptidase/peptidoglycan binding protein [Eggerthellaceae bacterium]|nr:L,D-transpeptidase/peptidoglycan binding protein [Eggerthellaceae bacterium]
MGIFNKRGKHAPGAQDADATVALDKNTFNSDETAALTTATSAGETEPLDKSAINSAKTEAIAIPGNAAGDSTMLMPKAENQTAGTQPDGGPTSYPPSIPAIQASPSGMEGFSTVPERKSRRGLKAFVITFVVLALILAGVYVGIALMFKTQFMPNTYIEGLDVSMMKDDEVGEIIDKIPAQYQLDVTGGDFSLHMTGEDIGMTIDTEAIIQAMHEEQNAWYWPWYATSGTHDESELVKTSYDKAAANALVKSAVMAFNKKATPPTDASIYFDEDSQTFAIKPEEIGTQLKIKAVQTVVNAAIGDMQTKAELTDEQLRQPKLLSTDKKLVDTTATANGLVSTHLLLQINGSTVTEIGSEMLSGFVKISDKFEVTFDDSGLAGWVDEIAGSYDTVGMQRNYTRADGKNITVAGGTYGWEVDKATLSAQILDAIKAGGESKIEIPCIDSANVYAGYGQRDWGNRYIDVDLSEQHVRFYGDDGSIIWETDCISGAPDGEHETPSGVWYVIMKQSPSVLIGYKDKEGKIKDYEEEVKYWMPFVGNSVGFHDATWQPSFGGDMYAQGYGSHGCVNLSYSAAQSLYEIIQPNDVVVVHY